MFPSTPLQLYRMPISGHCHRVELMLSLLGLPYELIDVNLLRGEHQRAEFLALNPLGQVPVLVDAGQVLSDSNGILALAGIIIRNSVILVTQIDEFVAQGFSQWDAVVEATNHRRRPILLTAAAASLGMIPIAREVFWGPMAYAMIGGIIVATLLTLLFLPALYVAWYKIREPENSSKTQH